MKFKILHLGLMSYKLIEYKSWHIWHFFYNRTGHFDMADLTMDSVHFFKEKARAWEEEKDCLTLSFFLCFWITFSILRDV